MVYEVVETHVTEIKHGDVIVENGELVTVGREYIKNEPLLGVCIRGNSYNGGRIPVMKAVIKRAMPSGQWVNA